MESGGMDLFNGMEMEERRKYPAGQPSSTVEGGLHRTRPHWDAAVRRSIRAFLMIASSPSGQ